MRHVGYAESLEARAGAVGDIDGVCAKHEIEKRCRCCGPCGGLAGSDIPDEGGDGRGVECLDGLAERLLRPGLRCSKAISLAVSPGATAPLSAMPRATPPGRPGR